MPGAHEKELFVRALEIEDPQERNSFLDQACEGDAELRARLEMLLGLESASEQDSFLESDANGIVEALADSAADEDHADPEEILGEFGDYDLIEVIARGAMGVVYKARQRSLNRLVAVKMIRSALLASEKEVQRFLNEAEAAAQLDHPNIVPIHEIGACEGEHFFSMKYVEGGTLTDQMERLRGDHRAAATLMSKVAHAVHAAHQRGIIHRDLKPANVLVDESGEPHVTDFGLAKQLDGGQGLTLSGQMMGTPYYMAPEQVHDGGKGLTTAADIYSLGAVFYEILAGRPPFKGDSVLDTLNRARDQAVPPIKNFERRVDRDLETIALRCLAKRPADRYSSAEALADDLDRWLRGEPITARPVTGLERVLMWVKRRPVYAGLWGTAGVLVLLLGIGGPLVAIQQVQLRDAAEAARIESEGARKDAEAILAFQTGMLRSPRPDAGEGGREVKVVDVLDGAVKLLAADPDYPPHRRAKLQTSLGTTYQALGLTLESIALLEESRNYLRSHLGDSHPDTLDAMYSLARSYFEAGRREEALSLREKVAALRSKVSGPEHSATLKAKRALADSYFAAGRRDEAEAIWREVLTLRAELRGKTDPGTIAMMNDLPIHYFEAGHEEEALQMQEEGLALSEKVLGPTHRDTLGAMTNLAVLYLRSGRVDEGIDLQEKALSIKRRTLAPGDPFLVAALQSMSALYAKAGRQGDAIRMQEEYLEIQRHDRARNTKRSTAVAGPGHHATAGSEGFFRITPYHPFPMEFVLVGDPGNPPDHTGFGAVSYEYRIGRYEVTNAQYTKFLNAVAGRDPNHLYDPEMATDAAAGIVRLGSPGQFTYRTKPLMADKPVNFIDYWDRCRFCNWLHNGQPGGAQGPETTEDGAYDLTEAASVEVSTVVRKAGARYFLPTEDEWYKAAYHDPRPEVEGGPPGDDHYWLYPTRSDQAPAPARADSYGNLTGHSANLANYNRAADWNGQDGNVTAVGSGGSGSASYYGAFDMGGNVFEPNESWSESDSGRFRGTRGGAWHITADRMRSTQSYIYDTSAGVGETALSGIRVAAQPVEDTD